jgi:transcription elongation factor Elf1
MNRRNDNERVSDGDRTPVHLQIEELEEGGFSFAIIYDFYRGSIFALAQYDAVIIQWTDPIFSTQTVSRIRSHFDQFIFLKPIFFLRQTGGLSGFPAQIADGCISHLQYVSSLTSNVQFLQSRIAQVDLSRTQTYEEQTIFNYLAFQYSRGREQIAPFIDRHGIYYPVLTDMMQSNLHQKHFLSVLEKMERETYVEGVFDQSTYVCSECLGDHLLYREVCPGCHAAHLKSEEIVHHFRCAHMAPLSDYRQSPHAIGLECPKCHHELKHIGVDYDKPATMHHCLSCQADFQHYAMMAKCTACGHDQQVEHLIKKELKKYSLTDKAINALKAGRLNQKDHALEPLVEDTLTWQLFIRTIDFEVAQQKSNNNHLVVLHFHDLTGMIRQIGEENKHRFFSEIVQIIRSAQQPFDFRGVKFPRLFFTLMQTRVSDAETIAQRMVFLINHLLLDNLRLKRVLLTYEVVPMDSQAISSILTQVQTV